MSNHDLTANNESLLSISRFPSTLQTLASSERGSSPSTTSSVPTTLGGVSANSAAKETVLGAGEFDQMVEILTALKKSSVPSSQDSNLPLPTTLADMPPLQLRNRDLADWTDEITDGFRELTASDPATSQFVQGAGLLVLTGAVVWMLHKWGPVGMDKGKKVLQHCRAHLRRRGVHVPHEDQYELLPTSQAAEEPGESITSEAARAPPSLESDASEEQEGPDDILGQSVDVQPQRTIESVVQLNSLAV